ncbi:MAG TPA: alpha-galactosidase, partial [Bacteroidales bacterium]
MKKSYLMLLLCSSFFYGTTSLHALNPSKSPLMGWASWNNFGVNISESIIKGQADAMVLSGLSDAGYTYLNIDDGFFNGRYSNGALRIDSIK